MKSVKLWRNAAKYALMAGRFDKEFAYTPIGAVEPNGQQVQWELINIFRYTDEGRLLEEWVQTDTYEFLRQLSAVAEPRRAPLLKVRSPRHRGASFLPSRAMPTKRSGAPEAGTRIPTSGSRAHPTA